MKSGQVLWLMGPTSSGKTTLATKFVERQRNKGIPVIHFDGDEVRDFFGDSLGFAGEDRLRVVKTLVHLVNKAAEAGVHVVVSALTANDDARRYVAANIANLSIGYVECSIDVCASRDPKGLYARAKNGEIATLVGFNSTYLPPEHPDIILNTENSDVESVVHQIEEYFGAQVFAAEAR